MYFLLNNSADLVQQKYLEILIPTLQEVDPDTYYSELIWVH